MSSHQVRLGSTLTFDKEKEKDIIECIERLSQSHRLGNFIAHLLRLAFESPEEFGTGQEVLNLVNKMNEIGTSPTRYDFFTQVVRETENMKKKIDSIYEMAYKTYMLSQMGKTLGLEEKSDNSLRAAFILERQITDMCESLGVNNFNHSFVSNKLEDTHKRAEEVLEYVIESYDSILNELKDSLSTKAINIVAGQYETALMEKNIKESKSVVDNNAKNNAQNDLDKPSKDDDEEIVLTEKPNKLAKEQLSKPIEPEIIVPIPDENTGSIIDLMLM